MSETELPLDEPDPAPEPGNVELEKSSNLQLSIREIEKAWARSDDMDELAHQLLSTLEHFGSYKYRVARALSSYRKGLHHGGWLPLVAAVAAFLGVTDRSVRQWVANCEATETMPPQVVDRLRERGYDLASTKGLDVAREAVQGWLGGKTIEDAIDRAEAKAAGYQPPPLAIHDLTPIEQWLSGAVQRAMPAFAHVPENSKEEVILALTNFLLWTLTPCRNPITIIPTEPTIDLSGRRRSP